MLLHPWPRQKLWVWVILFQSQPLEVHFHRPYCRIHETNFFLTQDFLPRCLFFVLLNLPLGTVNLKQYLDEAAYEWNVLYKITFFIPTYLVLCTVFSVSLTCWSCLCMRSVLSQCLHRFCFIWNTLVTCGVLFWFHSLVGLRWSVFNYSFLYYRTNPLVVNTWIFPPPHIHN